MLFKKMMKTFILPSVVAVAACGASWVQASVTTSPENHLLSTLSYVELEAEQGDKSLQLFLGRAYLEGSSGLEVDTLKGMYWLEKAAVDAPQVKTLIGDLFKQGQLLPKDYQRAVEWYTLAAKEGDVPAMVEMGNFYASGALNNGKMDCANAVRWYGEASNHGSLTSKRNLVWLHATCDDESVRDGELALRLAKQVMSRVGSGDAGDYDNLAAAYAACGEFKQAVEAQEMAISKLDEGSAQRIASFEERLNAYREKHNKQLPQQKLIATR